MLNTETPTTEALRLAETYGRDARELIRACFCACEDACTAQTLIYWRARLAAREAARYLKLTEEPNQ